MRKLIDKEAQKRIIREYLRVLAEFDSETKYPKEYDVFKEVGRRCGFHFMRVSKVINRISKCQKGDFDYSVVKNEEVKIKNKALQALKNE